MAQVTATPTYEEHLDVPYATESPATRQALDLFLPTGSSALSPLLVFIHGGAWVSESKSNFRTTLVPTLLASTSLPLAVLEYRLAPESPHPAQILDVLSGLSLLASAALLPLEQSTPRWDRNTIILIGHSAGAFLAAEVVLDPPEDSRRRTFEVPADVRDAVKGIICVDGIYDLPALLEEYPEYHYFVDKAFGTDARVLAEESPARWGLGQTGKEGVKVLVLHSREDELLSLNQPQLFVHGLEILVREEGPVDDLRLVADYDTLKGGHEQVLRREELSGRIASWLRQFSLR